MNMFGNYTQASPFAGNKGKMASPMSKPFGSPRAKPILPPRPLPIPSPKPSPMPAPSPAQQPQPQPQNLTNNPYSLSAFGMPNFKDVSVTARGNKTTEKINIEGVWNDIVKDLLSQGEYGSKLDFLRAALSSAKKRFDSSGQTWGIRDPRPDIAMIELIQEAIVKLSQTNLPPAWS